MKALKHSFEGCVFLSKQGVIEMDEGTDIRNSIGNSETIVIRDYNELPDDVSEGVVVLPFSDTLVQVLPGVVALVTNDMKLHNADTLKLRTFKDLTITVFVWLKDFQAWTMINPSISAKVIDGRWDTFKTVNNDPYNVGVEQSNAMNNPHLMSVVKDVVRSVRSLFQILACENVEMKREPIAEKLQRKRKKKGLNPYQESHYVYLKSNSRGSTSASVTQGDRRSPKPHRRRSHIRVYHRGEPTEYQKLIPMSYIGSGTLDENKIYKF